VRHVREVAAWLGQQFSAGMLASICEGSSTYILNLCIRHDIADLDVGTTFWLPREACRRKEIAMRPK